MRSDAFTPKGWFIPGSLFCQDGETIHTNKADNGSVLLSSKPRSAVKDEDGEPVVKSLSFAGLLQEHSEGRQGNAGGTKLSLVVLTGDRQPSLPTQIMGLARNIAKQCEKPTGKGSAARKKAGNVALIYGDLMQEDKDATQMLYWQLSRILEAGKVITTAQYEATTKRIASRSAK